MGILANENAISAGGYTIQKSLRFRASASAYLNRTPASAGNRKTWTWSGWVKRGALSTDQAIFSVAGSTNTTYFLIKFDANNLLYIGNFSTNFFTTSQVFRDPSAWYHIVVVLDTTQAVANDRLKLYVNGSQVTAFATNNISAQIAQNSDQGINQAASHNIGREAQAGAFLLDGYQAEVNFIDGQALTPSSFGSTNATTGVWQPAKYTGTYGTNGFYLPFTNTSTTSTLVADSSGNGNNWTPNNISLTAGVTYDSMLDSPTNSLTSLTQPVGNYSTLNPLKISGATLAGANLQATTSEGQFYTNTMNIPSTGKWYWEFTLTSITGGSNQGVLNGVAPSNSVFSGFPNASSFAVSATLALSSNWIIYQNGSVIYTSSKAFAAGDVVQYALDRDNQRFWLGVNGTWYASGTPNPSTNTSPTISYTTTGDLEIMCQGGGGGTGSSVVNWNFGQRPFTYTPPTGFKALCTTNLPDSTIVKGNKYMDAQLWTGDGVNNRVISQYSFQPDLTWIKTRSSAYWHVLADTVRGANKALFSNSTSAESTNDANGYTSAISSTGFTLTSGSTSINDVNQSGQTYVGWGWNAGSGTTSSNTSGSITSTVSVNATAGFSIVTYTGNGSSGATVGHGLGVAPAMIITKRRNTTGQWGVYNKNLPAGYVLLLSSTGAQANDSTYYTTTLPTSSVYSLGSTVDTNGSGSTFVSYCFAEIAGYSKFGSYTGNGSADGTFVYTGFRPKFVMFKNSSAVTDWNILDSSRNTYNATGLTLQPDNSGAEQNGWYIDLLSNGFKIRTTLSDLNGSGNTIIFAAFSESPFKNALAR